MGVLRHQLQLLWRPACGPRYGNALLLLRMLCCIFFLVAQFNTHLANNITNGRQNSDNAADL